MNKFEYDEQVRYLTENPDRIFSSWGNAEGIFQMVRDDNEFRYDNGCLTAIRHNKNNYAYINGQKDIKLTEEIRADERIPINPERITPADFPVFIEWRNRIDKLIEERKNKEVNV